MHVAYFGLALLLLQLLIRGRGVQMGMGILPRPALLFLVGSMRCSTEIIFSPSCMFRFWLCFVFGFLVLGVFMFL